MAECNSFFNGGAPNVSDAYGTALWSLDYMFNCALAQCSGVNFHGGGNGNGYTPIAENNGSVVEARPLLYGMAMFSQLAQGYAISASVTLGQSVNFTAYGVARADGGTNVLLVNKDPGVTVVADVGVDASVSRMVPLTLSGAALSATTGITLGGTEIGSDGLWTPDAESVLPTTGGQVTVDVPPLTALLLASA